MLKQDILRTLNSLPESILPEDIESEREANIQAAISRRMNGERFYTIGESMACIDAAIARGAKNAIL